MKGKKVFIIPTVFTVLLFIICIILGFTCLKTPPLIATTQKAYRFLNGLKYFCILFPAIVLSGFFLGLNFDFGKDSEQSRVRFSHAMFRRYKKVLLTALCGVLVISVVSEVVLPLINSNMHRLESFVSLERSYVSYIKTLLKSKRYKLAESFGELAFELNPNNPEITNLLEEAKIGSNTYKEFSSSDMTKILSQDDDPQKMKKASEYMQRERSLDAPYTSLELLNLARSCFEKKDWFGAHYYAQTAIGITSERDLNVPELKHIAAEAWNMISTTREKVTGEQQKVFAQKCKGYNALMENDNFGAYYIFKRLESSSRENAVDPDIVRYLDIAEKRLSAQSFFSDETVNIRGFESANDIYFKIQVNNEFFYIYYITGTTNVNQKDDFVQYLRGFSVFKVGNDGTYISGAYSSYAKMLTISTSNFDMETKKALGITDDMKYVPYIILRSIDREEEDKEILPMLLYGDENLMKNGFLIIPMDVSDFTVLKEASDGVESMSIGSIVKMAGIAKKYGYAQEVYNQEILNRLFLPLFCLIYFLFLAIFAWNTRFPGDSLFKFQWIFVVPVVVAVLIGAYNVTLVAFKFMNYMFLSIVKSNLVIPIAFAFYAVIFIMVSVTFLSLRNVEAE